MPHTKTLSTAPGEGACVLSSETESALVVFVTTIGSPLTLNAQEPIYLIPRNNQKPR
jgi:hypothetical protein